MSCQVVQVQDRVLLLKQQLESILARLPSPPQPQAEKSGANATLNTENAPDISTCHPPVASPEPWPSREREPEEPTPEGTTGAWSSSSWFSCSLLLDPAASDSPPLPENGCHPVLWVAPYADFSAEDSDMLKDDGENRSAYFLPPNLIFAQIRSLT
jgi:hypothetical protein